MPTITSHSMLSNPLQTNLCIFKRLGLSDENCIMNSIESVALPHSLIKLPKRERDQQPAQMSPQHCYGSENSQSNSICDMDPLRPVHDLDAKFSINTAALVDERTSSEVARSNSVSSLYRGDNNNKDDDEEVYMNYCSDDSELSVGKEVVDDLAAELSGSNMDSGSNNKKSSFQLNDSLFINRNSDTIKLPSIIRPNPTRQEEVLYKTHMYAEEIMKHQLNFMTVTKGLNISPTLNQNAFCPYLRSNDVNHINNTTASVNNSLKIGFSYLQAYANDSDLGKKWSVIEDRGNRSAETTHFRQIHSHLNAISKMSSALGRNACTKSQQPQTMLASNTSSRESSQSPPSSNASSSAHHHHILHNDFNESSLKFSIDNILKPSFGRRITDPLWKRNKPARKSCTTQRITTHTTNLDGIDSTPLSSTESITAIEKKIASHDDRTIGPATAAKESPSNNVAEHTDKTNSTAQSASASASSSDASNKGPISWPAWVYCTRYR